MNALFRVVVCLVIAMFLLVPLFNASAQFIDPECKLQGEGSLAECIKKNTHSAGGFFGDPKINLPQFIGNLIKFALTLVGTIFLLLIIWAGFRWMTAGGNTEQVKSAAQTMRNSVIGLVIIILAYAITITIFDVVLAASVNV